MVGGAMGAHCQTDVVMTDPWGCLVDEAAEVTRPTIQLLNKCKLVLQPD